MKNLEIEILLNLKIGIIFNFKSKFFVTNGSTSGSIFHSLSEI